MLEPLASSLAGSCLGGITTPSSDCCSQGGRGRITMVGGWGWWLTPLPWSHRCFGLAKIPSLQQRPFWDCQWVVSSPLLSLSQPFSSQQHCLPHLTLLLPPDLFCCVPHPLLDTPVLHALFSTPQHAGRICSPSRMAFGSLGCPQLGGLELPPGWDPHWCQELPL